MRIQLLSDVHLEIERTPSVDGEGDIYKFNFDAAEDATALALLGDIGMTVDPRLFDWLGTQLKRFPLVLFVQGNHEPYWSTLEESRQRLVQFEKENKGPGKFVLLDCTRYDLSPTLTILGCTLWAALDPKDDDIHKWSVTDFKRISGFKPDDFRKAHKRDVHWLADSLAKLAREEPDRRVLIMTHHAPTMEGTRDPKFSGLEDLNKSAFATELVGGQCWDAERVKVWMFGHTHWNCDFVKENIRVVSNQRGYKSGSQGFMGTKVIEVD